MRKSHKGPSVIIRHPERSEGSPAVVEEVLRFAQDDALAQDDGFIVTLNAVKGPLQ